ncbi:tyrosine-type recombinase/integrase [Rivularia sp. IAM M-261]|nr:tyrosine-type recombinase/integrase [Rivularia sp. IAM M-261]
MKESKKNKQSNFEYITEQREAKYQYMKSQLIEYWAKDIWSPASNPLRGSSKIRGSCLHFEKCPGQTKVEIKFFCYQKVVNQDWNLKTLHQRASKINRICEWLHSQHSHINSLLDKKLDEWVLSLRTYLIATNKYYGCQSFKLLSTNQMKGYKKEDECIYKFQQIYNFLLNFYDDRDEYDKEIWDTYKLGFEEKDTNATRYRWFDFSDLKSSWLYLPVKKFIKYKLPLIALGTCNHKLLSLKVFNKFLSMHYPAIKASEINRQVIVDYLGYLMGIYANNEYHHRFISDLRDFLEVSFREKWVNVTGNKVIYDDDFPKRKRSDKPRYIPEEVIQQIMDNLSSIKNPAYQRMFLILIECGMRISELCNLRLDCITTDSAGEYLLQYYQSKFKKYITVPISLEVVRIIQTQQEYIRNIFDANCNLLFASERYKSKLKPISYAAFCQNLKLLVYEKDIRDINGKLWVFTSHQCRHTVGFRMINNGVPQHIVQKYLGHESPAMTQVYAHIHDTTLRKEVEKYYESRVVNFQGQAIEISSTILDDNDELEWFKNNVQARALEHGYCARPKVLGDCDIPGFEGCYNCPHWRTNKNFLPILKSTLERTNSILKKAQDFGWNLQVKKNLPLKENLEKVIKTLELDNE